MTFSQSHWGIFESPAKIGDSEMIPVRGPSGGLTRVKYETPLLYWDGKRWVHNAGD